MIRAKLQKLKQIQTMDLEIDKVEHRIKGIPEALLSIKDKLDAALLSLDELKKTLFDVQEQRGKLDLEIQDVQSEHIKAEERAKIVKTPKEYQLSVREVGALKGRLKDSNDALSKAKEVIEKLEKRIEEEEAKYVEVRGEYEKRQAEAKAQIDALRGSIQETVAKRLALAQEIGADVMTRYDRIRSGRGGIAVVDVVNMTCLGCYMNIPPQYYNELLMLKDIRQCLSCQRMLVVPEEPIHPPGEALEEEPTQAQEPKSRKRKSS